ncbi:beta-lactamase family protein [Psychrosphaera sp.]|nr:beta-lactamase family protein [Psychrosphaera sp.]
MKTFFLFIVAFLYSFPTLANKELAPSFINVFNEGSRIEVINYLSDNMSKGRIETYGIDAHVGVFLNSQNTFGHLDVIKALPPSNGNERIEVISNNNKLKYNLIINKENSAPYKINYFTLQDSKSENNSKKSISTKELAQDLSNFINNLSMKDAFSGSVLVAIGKNVIFKDSVGYANKTWKSKNNIDTKFSLGSMNKMFTAIAALQLIEKGKLQFDDKLIQFVDKSWLPKVDSDSITIRQLLTHTSGLGNFFNDEFNQSNKEAYRNLEAYKPLISQSELLFKPGSRNRYSNSGMLMLGLVVEKVSGESYYDYVQKHIYNKANMPNSGSFELDSITDNLASGYLKRMHSDQWVDSIYTRAIKGSPAGGGFSTAEDLHQFAIALTEFKLLGKELTEDAYTEKTQYNSAFWYGYGFSVSGEENNRVVGHGGAYLGVDSRLDIHLDSGFIVVILANQSGVVAPVRRKIDELIGMYSL